MPTLGARGKLVGISIGLFTAAVIVVVVVVLTTAKPARKSVEKKDCVVSNWTNWSTCCGGSEKKTRMRTIQQHPANGGQACPELSEEDENKEGCGVDEDIDLPCVASLTY